jgi:HAD superfamily hydrolase (TIGR01509 family)
MRGLMAIDAVVFDLDGVLIQSEEVWDQARRALAGAADVPWPDDATAAMMGMSSPEWARYMHEEVGVPSPPDQINAAVVRSLEQRYRRELPLIEGAQAAVARLAEHWPLGLATSSNREIVELVLDVSDLARHFAVTVSSEEVGAGKPAPDVYLETVRRLETDPQQCVAIEDSTNGIRSAVAAGMAVIAIPNPAHAPARSALEIAATVLDSLADLTADAVRSAAA